MTQLEVNIAEVHYPSFNSTNGVAIDIFLTGCTQYCKGCHNPNLWDKNAGIRMNFEELDRLIKSRKNASSIAVMGGEPMENPLLPDFLKMLVSHRKEIWLYTSFSLEKIPEDVKQYCDYIKTGRYDIDLHVNGSRLSSTNQQIYAKTEEGFKLYYDEGKKSTFIDVFPCKEANLLEK